MSDSDTSPSRPLRGGRLRGARGAEGGPGLSPPRLLPAPGVERTEGEEGPGIPGGRGALSPCFFSGGAAICVCVCRGESGLSPRWAREGGEGLGPPLSVPPVTPVRPFPRSLSLGSFPSSVRVGLLAASRDKPK